ncbi:MAG TPA: cupin domain-containing protein [Candidatus Saccharimonadales bacterium]|nr:cupin domain-containing protein [Candidatus Saccharimonadales bacterium]
METRYKKGNVFQEQERNGWIFGSFMPNGDLAKDDRAEVKIAELDNTFTSEPHYNKTSTKLDIIWQGEAIWNVDGKDIEMKPGDYLIIPPKTVVGVKKVVSNKLVVQTIRFPSTPDDKVMVNN